MKYCTQCGASLADNAKFCNQCGTPVQPATVTSPPLPPASEASDATATPMPTASAALTPPPPPALAAKVTGKKRKRISYDNEVLKQGVTLCDDGKYRWIHELSLWTNPSILILVYKVFGIAFGIVGLFILILTWEDIEFTWEEMWPVLAFIGFFAVLILFSYAIFALIYGGKYIVIFTMDEHGINHEQIASQAKKAKKLGMVTAAAGALSGKPGMVGLGISSAARTSMYSTFSSVRSVKRRKWRNLIKIREILSNNQVYVHDKDFDFVYNYIKEHCPRVK